MPSFLKIRQSVAILCEVWGSQDDEYADGCLLGHSDVGDSKLPWNVGQYVPKYAAHRLRRRPSAVKTLLLGQTHEHVRRHI